MDDLFLFFQLLGHLAETAAPFLLMIAIALCIYLGWKIVYANPVLKNAADLCKRHNKGGRLSDAEWDQIDHLLATGVIQTRGLKYHRKSGVIINYLQLSDRTIDAAFGA